MRRLRRAGTPWRVLAHHPDGTTSHDTESDQTEFDELVVGRWLHVEQMDTGSWWADVGGVTLLVRVDRDGRPTHVTTYPAGGYADRVPGCAYSDGA